MLFTTIFWWWWEFRLQQIRSWTFQLYFFDVSYAFLLYLVCALLFPRDLQGYDGFRQYLLSRRRWIFGLMLLGIGMDLVDTLAKGMEYFASLGWEYVAVQSVLAIIAVTAMVTRREWVHATIVVIAVGIQVVRVAVFYNSTA